jgi:hypothetical protein
MHSRDVFVVVDQDVVHLSGGVSQDRIVDVAHLLHVLSDEADTVVALKSVAPVAHNRVSNLHLPNFA